MKNNVLLLANILLGESEDKEYDSKFSEYVTKLMLRIMQSTSYLTYLSDMKFGMSGEDLSVEMVFCKIPNEYVQGLVGLLGRVEDLKIYSFIRDARDFTGIKYRLPSDGV